jgi:DNA-binding transcriptional LysR family regulator
VPTPTVTLPELAEHPWILSGPRSHFGRAVRLACQRSGFEPTINHEVEEQSTALAMVAAGLGVTLVSDLGRIFCPPSGVVVVPLERPLSRRILIAHLPHTGERPAARAALAAFSRAAVAHDLAPAPSG